ncbi:polyphosphate:AMP phosphotransferase [Steroidobacter sp.]|uniref:polyphosphate:AMP phosphotransferase n=1 Tax=Steroidobacter sp. TaxID=1978227 RepID=UPI001A4327C3|nr:polyphosphate:AMP phosphotransferase [Steroidobacter sp.]MBL8266157.1 polyphosphate:AMP phosphotransferase [Steroidobacter sp.]
MAVRRISKAAFERTLPALRDELLDLQLKLHTSKSCAVAVIIAGTPAAGRSETVNELLEWLDPKHIGVHALGVPSTQDRKFPALWRYWQKLPARGRITFFFAGWYGEYLGGVSQPDSKAQQHDKRAVERILRLENMLVRDGVRVVKIYLHTDHETQLRRLEQLRASKLTRWRVTKEDRWQAKHFQRVQRVVQSCLKATNHQVAPWHRVDGTDEEYRLLSVGKILRDEIAAGIKAREQKRRDWPQEKLVKAAPVKVVQPARPVDDDEYERQLETLQGRLARLVQKSRFCKHGLVLAFEGMDAAGKGGAIRRVTHALDARQYQVVPVSAPTPEELSYPYLWRFWRHVPAQGSIAIFDRSWYGRVLVERVRDLTPDADWKRAYAEIVEFERQLTEQGLLVAKFWLSVGKDEQLRRFKSRDEDPLKRFKVDREDWANRRYYDAYQTAAAEMIRRTDADHAKWTVVAADDKKLARLTVLKAVCETLER